MMHGIIFSFALDRGFLRLWATPTLTGQFEATRAKSYVSPICVRLSKDGKSAAGCALTGYLGGLYVAFQTEWGSFKFSLFGHWILRSSSAVSGRLGVRRPGGV